MTRKILIYIPKPASVGGMEMHLVRLAHLYAQSGAQVTIVATGNSLSQQSTCSLAKAGVHMRVPNEASKDVTALNSLLFLGAIWPRLRRTRWDLILTNGHSFWAVFIWLLASPGTRVAHHHHTTGDILEQNHWSFWYFVLLRWAPIVITCSAYSGKCIGQLKTRGRVVAMPYLVDPSLGPVSPRATEKRPFRFGYIGRLVKSKGIDRIIELSKRVDLSGVEWVLYGTLGEYKEQDFAGLKRLRYCGVYSTTAELQTIFSELDALVLFSEHSEGMPVCLLEAAAAGLPWIASDIGGVRELSTTDSRNQLVPRSPSSEACATAVHSLQLTLCESGRLARPSPAFERKFSYNFASQRWQAFLTSGIGAIPSLQIGDSDPL